VEAECHFCCLRDSGTYVHESCCPLPMWDVEGSGMVPLPNMVADFRDTDSSKVLCGIFLANPCLGAAEIPQNGIWGTALFQISIIAITKSSTKMKYLCRIFCNDVVGGMQEQRSSWWCYKGWKHRQLSTVFSITSTLLIHDILRLFHADRIRKHRFVPTSKGCRRSIPTKVA
jgi:hypothetical protein